MILEVRIATIWRRLADGITDGGVNPTSEGVDRVNYWRIGVLALELLRM